MVLVVTDSELKQIGYKCSHWDTYELSLQPIFFIISKHLSSNFIQLLSSLESNNLDIVL